MGANPHTGVKRPDGALLAGVCAGIARALRWNVWVLRALFVGFLAIKTVPALIAYAILALAMHLFGTEKLHGKRPSEGLASPELSQRSKRIADLEQQFRDLEDSDRSGAGCCAGSGRASRPRRY
jgi:phage shock protein PspC (stress-responsive transcriptional regulator)